MHLADLPTDIITFILHTGITGSIFSVTDLAALSCTSKIYYNLVRSYGWPTYVRANPRPSFSLTKSRQVWSPAIRVGFDCKTDRAWEGHNHHFPQFIARPLSHPWARKQQPTLAINEKRLVIAAGNIIYLYSFGISSLQYGSPPLIFDGSVSLRGQDITALTFVQENTLICGFRNGMIARILLDNGFVDGEVKYIPLHTANMNTRDLIESISSSSSTSGSLYLALSSKGKAYLGNLSLTPVPTQVLDLSTRSWSTYLSTSGSHPFAVFGCSSSPSTPPLSVYSLHEHGAFSDTPTAILGTWSKDGPGLSGGGAVYGICEAPPASPWGSSPQIIISGWYDGKVRVYDLRSSARSLPDSTSMSMSMSTPAPILPTLTLSDPWSIESIYSVSSGGGAAAQIAAGSARHSVVSFWDVRNVPARNSGNGGGLRGGWSVYAPGNDPSPVYSLIMESSRVFGVTESRPFVFDFGPNVTQSTYPPFTPAPGLATPNPNSNPNLRLRKAKSRSKSQAGGGVEVGLDLGYYVTRYSHQGGLIDY